MASADFVSRVIALRRDLHQTPEIGWQEHETAELISTELGRLGIDHTTGVAGTGIIAEIPGSSEGPRIALRADMDALPVTEATGLEFASRNEGRMHACGHDAHMAIMLGAACLLADEPAPGPVRLVFQPAEELAGGALAMIEAGALEGVAMIFGGHVDGGYPAGTLVVHEGTVNASTDAFRVIISGKGGHAARPQATVDPVVVGSHAVIAAQSIVARQLDPSDPAVLTVATFHAGTAHNIIPSEAVLEGTMRAQTMHVRDHLREALGRMMSSVASAHAATANVEFLDGTPPVVNTPEIVDLARPIAITEYGQSNVVALARPNMGGEDFAHYLIAGTGGFFRIGVGRHGEEPRSAHSENFDIDESALVPAATFFAALARRAGQNV